MLVRFNKGPWHRKVRQITPEETRRGIVNVAVPDKNFTARMFTNDANSSTFINAGIKIAMYRVKMVKVDAGNGPVTIPSVFPDGAICFEYEGTV